MKTYKQFAEEQTIIVEKETVNELFPLAAIGGIARAAVGAARMGAAVIKHAPKIARAAGTVAKVAGRGASGALRAAGGIAKGAGSAIAKGGAIAATNAAANKNERDSQQKAYKDKQKPQAKKDRDAMGRHEEVEIDEAEAGGFKLHNGEETMVKEDWVDDEARKVERRWKSMNKQSKVRWVDMMHDKAGKRNMSDAELEDWLDDYNIDISREASKKWESASVEEMAYEMNQYVNTLSIDRNRNLWSEAAKQGEDPEPVKGKKSMTGEKQEKVTINPKEALPARGPRIGRLG